MSAYLVSTNTIHVIVRGGLQYGLVKRATAGLVGQSLIEANHWSLVARYSGDEMPPFVEYRLPVEVPKLKPEVIVGCVACYEYQACEFSGWTDSAAHHYTAALVRRIERGNPGIMERYASGSEEFPWGIRVEGIEALAPYALPA